MTLATPLRYGLPMLALAALGAAFLWPRRRMLLGQRAGFALRIVAALPLVVSGTVHVLRPGMFVPALPPPLPASPALIIWTGIPELLGAAGLFVPKTRRAASAALAVFLVAVFPANIYIAGRTIGGLSMPGVPVRTAMQAAYMVLILTCGWGWPKRPQEEQ